MSQDFEKAKAFLKKSSQDGSTLYDHITNVLLKIAKDKPADALGEFEKVSKDVKSANLDPALFPEIPSNAEGDATITQIIDSVDSTLSLFDNKYCSTADKAAAIAAYDKINTKNEDEEDEEGPKPTVNDLLPASLKSAAVPDLVGSAELLDAAGYGLDKNEMYRVTLSVRKLARTVPVESVRFFGKIYGIEKNYYICEAKLIENEKEEIDRVAKKEQAGKGANEFVYYVTNSPEDSWTKLPDVIPEQIITARAMRRYFTGNLQSNVKGNVRFPWPEASYLRTQIARISAAATVSPKGFYTVEEGDEEEGIPDKMLEDPEYEALGSEELKEAENWVHHRAHLLKQARTVKYEEPEGEEEEEEEPEGEEEEEEEEEPIALLGGLDADTAKGFKPLWRFDTTPEGIQHSVSCAVSLQWPGAVSVAQKKKFANIYVGWGQKQLGTLYTPPNPAPVQSEYVSGFNPEEAEEDETDPTLEQEDPLPPKESDEGDEGDEDE